MNELIEIEYKMLLDENIFFKIKNDYKDRISHEYIQTNYYFTHPLIKQKRMMLRIREKNNEYELTLKRPYFHHRLETNVSLSIDEKESFFNHLEINNEIIEILKNEGIDYKDVVNEYSLTTHRCDIVLDEGVLSLDENVYLNKKDYEIEFEVNDSDTGLKKFNEIIKPYNLIYITNCKSKVRRALDAYLGNHHEK